MKKFALFAGVFGALFVTAGAYAAAGDIQVASTNRVRNSVYDVVYGATNSATTGDYNYRHGTVPQNNKLTSIEGTGVTLTGLTDSDTNWRAANLTTAVSGVTVGNLAVTTTTSGVTTPTESIKANMANVAVLKRDKLSTAVAGNCSSGECGYVTTGNHANVPADANGGRVWMQIATCTGSGANLTCTGD